MIKVVEKVTEDNQEELRRRLDVRGREGQLYKRYASYIETDDGKVCLVRKPKGIYEFYLEDKVNGVCVKDDSLQGIEYFLINNIRMAGYEYELEMINLAEKGELKPFLSDLSYILGSGNQAHILYFKKEDKPLLGDSLRKLTDEELEAYKKAVLCTRKEFIKLLWRYLKDVHG